MDLVATALEGILQVNVLILVTLLIVIVALEITK